MHEVVNVLINWTEGSFSQCIHISNHQNLIYVQIKYLIILSNIPQ